MPVVSAAAPAQAVDLLRVLLVVALIAESHLPRRLLQLLYLLPSSSSLALCRSLAGRCLRTIPLRELQQGMLRAPFVSQAVLLQLKSLLALRVCC
jgi:hypothetical protein